MKRRFFQLFAICVLAAAAAYAQAPGDPVVRFHTNLGNMDVELYQTTAPKTVANFLRYIDRPDYINLWIYRSIPGFIFQAGSYRFEPTSPTIPSKIPPFPPVQNEFKVSNTRGTIAMAKLGGDPNSATTDWFFNESDSNAANLDNQNGGFTVFGKVVDAASLAVMDKIAAVPVTMAYNAPFNNLPLIDPAGNITLSNVVLVSSITLLGPAPAITGILSASAFGGFTSAAPGSFIEIYGTNLAGSTRQWATADFNGPAAPTALDGVIVTVGGLVAYISYVSPTQINVQVPQGVKPGTNVPVVVTYAGQSSTAGTITINALQPGLLAPATFLVNGKQYVTAFHADGTYVTNGNIPGITGTPAKAGETIVLYGLGFGGVTDASVAVAGQIASGQTALANTVSFAVQGVPAAFTYAGLAPGFVGLDQFNVTIPSIVPSGDLTFTVMQSGTAIGQQLFIPVN